VPINIFAYQHGLYPRSEAVVAATRSLDRGRVDTSAVDGAFQRDETRFVEVQQQAGVDFFSDGLIRWQDIFRPLSEAGGPLRSAPLVRWFDTNTFFRAPDLSQAGAAPSPNEIVPAATVPRPAVVSLPSPYMFSRAARVGDRDRNRVMVEVAERMLAPAIKAAAAAGCRLVHLEEPWLAYFGIEKDAWAPFKEALSSVRAAGVSLMLHCYFGDAARFRDELYSLPVDGLGVDLVETDIKELGTGWDKDLLIGCINGRSSIVESLESTVELARRVTDIGFLPTTVAERKVQRLGEAAKRLKELVSV
jgi:5-methyltetrahydropteroyltriglutamate--homocysteine methyltransferase